MDNSDISPFSNFPLPLKILTFVMFAFTMWKVLTLAQILWSRFVKGDPPDDEPSPWDDLPPGI